VMESGNPKVIENSEGKPEIKAMARSVDALKLTHYTYTII